MTKKLKQILVIFMAVFMFSCAADESISMSPPKDETEDGGDVSGVGGNFQAGLDKARENLGSWSSSDTSPKMGDLTKKYLITKMGNTDFLALYIQDTGDDKYSDISVGRDASAGAAALGVAKQFEENLDPRKLLFDDGNGVRMAWAGLVADTPDNKVGPFTQYQKYDTKYHAALTTTGSPTYSIPPTGDGAWEAHPYPSGVKNPWTFSPRIEILLYTKATINNITRAWFWSIWVPENNVYENYVSLVQKGTLGFGTGNESTDFPYIKGRGDAYSSDLSEVGGTTQHNLDPPGKVAFARRVEKGAGTGAYDSQTAIFLSTVVGYNIKTRPDTRDALKTAIYGSTPPPEVKSLQYFYMEFDDSVYADAEADGYNSAYNFPHWGSLDENDGAGISPNTTVQKFTGILLEVE